MQQKRLLLALLISIGILFSWSYFFVKPTEQQPVKDTTGVLTGVGVGVASGGETDAVGLGDSAAVVSFTGCCSVSLTKK